MKIIIKNCNSIDEAEINLEINKLNIKYGINGTGKSTIARALELSVNPKADLSQLKPFKYRNKEATPEQEPSIHGSEEIKTVKIFNDDYVNNIAFRQDEVIKNSFNIFIKTKEYDEKMDEIEKLVIEIKNSFKDNEQIDSMIKDLGDLSESFGKSPSGYSKAGRLGKAIGKGNPVANIPADLVAYTDFIRSENNVGWIKWQVEGNAFLALSKDCPYCTSPTEGKHDQILAVEKQYDANSIQHLNALTGIIKRLGKYFTEQTIKELDSLLANKTELKPEELVYLKGLKDQIDILKSRLHDLKSLSFFSFTDVNKVIEKIDSLKINLTVLTHLNSPETTQIVTALNECLEKVSTKAGLLQGQVNQQKDSIQKTIEKHKREINEFLNYAGYKYSVEIKLEGEVYKMVLLHEDFKENIANANSCLSYGERNAFSLVLFMYETLSEDCDLIILDDPISSFDRNKKFAIIEMLFRGKTCFRGKTVLLMTHDIEPIIEITRNFADKFAEFSTASFLSSSMGKIDEIIITRSDIVSFSQVCKQNIAEHQEVIFKLIYLRRYFEVLDDKGLEYQMLSCLFHKKDHPDISTADEANSVMTENQILEATASITEWIDPFSYYETLEVFRNTAELINTYRIANNNYEKLQLFRIIDNENHENSVIRKFINETFHIENEYVMQLNPYKYDSVPSYIINECDIVIAKIEQ